MKVTPNRPAAKAFVDTSSSPERKGESGLPEIVEGLSTPLEVNGGVGKRPSTPLEMNGDQQRCGELEKLGMFRLPRGGFPSLFPAHVAQVEPLPSDLRAWLEPIAKTKKVVLFGEEHYFQDIAAFSSRIFFALNTFDSFPVYSIEFPYSVTPFAEHYVQLKDDAEAGKFLAQHLAPHLYDRQQLEMLDDVRR